MWGYAAELCYKQYGGSGTNLSLADFWELDWKHMLWWYDWLEERRKDEKQTLEDAYKAKK